MRFIWDISNTTNFLSCSGIYYVGATYDGSEDQLPRFLEQGIWENGWGNRKPLLTERVKGIKVGDILVVKRLMGKASHNMSILALGVVVGKIPHSNDRVHVEWALPETHTEVTTEMEGTPGSPPQVGLDTVGTISPRRSIDELPYVVQKLIKVCQARFLRMNLSIMRTAY